jgi:FMN-dependent NADH-azoreductase
MLAWAVAPSPARSVTPSPSQSASRSGFVLADRVLISTPMWNFGIPYKLKQRFDVIVQPGLAFWFDPAQGYVPLFKNRPTIVILASGGNYVTGINRGWADMATPYLRETLRFIGVSDVRFVPIGPTSGSSEPIRLARESAHRRVAEMAAGFLRMDSEFAYRSVVFKRGVAC